MIAWGSTVGGTRTPRSPAGPRAARAIAVTVSAVFGVACARSPEGHASSREPAPAPTSEAVSLGRAADAGTARFDVLERVTRGAPSDARLPIVVALHGMGDRPESWLRAADPLPMPVRLVAPRAPLPWQGGASWFTYPPVSEAAMAEEITARADDLARLVDEIRRTRPHDGRVIVTGFSQGGYLSFALGLLHPEGLTAVLPIAGGVPRPLLEAATKRPRSALPIVALHGSADSVVPPAPTRAAVDTLRAAGVSVELLEYAGARHEVRADMWSDLHARIAAILTR